MVFKETPSNALAPPPSYLMQAIANWGTVLVGWGSCGAIFERVWGVE